MTLFPPVFFAVLLALAHYDYRTCFLGPDTTALWALQRGFGDVVHPIMLVALLPFAGLAAIACLRDAQTVTIALWLGMIALGAFLMLPPSTLHDCDRKGMDAVFGVMMLAIPGIFACFIAFLASRAVGGKP